MKNAHFKPYVGKNYQQGFEGKKILVLGESHYGGAENSDFVNGLVSDFLDYKRGEKSKFKRWMNTYTKFTNVLFGEKISNDDMVVFWESIAFYNYVQTSIENARKSPTGEEFSNSEVAFFEVLAELKPDLVIAWGDRLFSKMPTNGKWSEKTLLDGSMGKVYLYTINEKDIPTFAVYHPSSRVFSYDATKYLQEFISNFKQF